MARSDWLPPTQHEPSNRLIVVAALGSCWRAIRRRGGDWFGEGAEGGGLFNPLACQPASQLLGLTRFDGHPTSGVLPLGGCPSWRPWNASSLARAGRSHPSSRPRLLSCASAVAARSGRSPGTST